VSTVPPTFVEECKKVLSLGYSQDREEYWENLWKILVCDTFGRDVLAPLFNFDELQKLGITLVMGLGGQRQPIPDVKALYIVSNTKENLDRIITDCATPMYSQVHLNFLSHLSESSMDFLAKGCLAANCVSAVASVADLHTNFISVEDALFSLNHKNSYIAFNNSYISNEEAAENVEKTVDGLFSMVVTLGKIPIIRCPKASAAEIIARKLYDRIHKELASIPNLFTNTSSSTSSTSFSASSSFGGGAGSSFQRPVLLLLDRNVDLSVMLSHGWCYQALCHDLLGMNLNRVKIDAGKGPATYDFQEIDTFWAANVGSPFPTVLVNLQTDIEETKRLDERIGSNSAAAEEGGAEGLSQLYTKLTLIPELNKKKEILAMHTDISSTLVELINKRHLDLFFRTEEDIVLHSVEGNIDKIVELLEEEKGTAEDKMRLFLIYYLTNSRTINAEELAMFSKLLQENGCNLSAIKFLQSIKTFHDTWATAAQTSKSNQQSVTGDLYSMFSSIVAKGFQFLPTTKNYKTTTILDAIMELKETEDVKDYLYLDPKFPMSSMPRKNTPFKEGIVFMIGGGNYLEYQNIRDFLQKQSAADGNTSGGLLDKQVIYGTTELLTGSQFLEQLCQLGETILD